MESIKAENGISVAIDSRIGGREENQDDFGMVCAPLGVLAVVCDGMGGGPGGKTASELSCEAIINTVVSAAADANAEQVLRQSVENAHASVMSAQESNPALRGMGSTCVCLLIQNSRALIAHVGDSRCYHIRHGKKVFRTADHSYVAELVRRGTITEEEARTSNYSNVITRAIGGAAAIDPEIDIVKVSPGDRFAMMSDGIWGTMPENTLIRTLNADMSAEQTAVQICTQVDTLGKDNGGGHDNLTLAIVDVPMNLSVPDEVVVEEEPIGGEEYVAITESAVQGNEVRQVQGKPAMTLNDSLAQKAKGSVNAGIKIPVPPRQASTNVPPSKSAVDKPEVAKHRGNKMVWILVALLIFAVGAIVILVVDNRRSRDSVNRVEEKIDEMRRSQEAGVVTDTRSKENTVEYVEESQPQTMTEKDVRPTSDQVAPKTESVSEQQQKARESLKPKAQTAEGTKLSLTEAVKELKYLRDHKFDGKIKRENVTSDWNKTRGRIVGQLDRCISADSRPATKEKLKQIRNAISKDPSIVGKPYKNQAGKYEQTRDAITKIDNYLKDLGEIQAQL